MAGTEGIHVIFRTELELRKIKSGPAKPYFLTWMHQDPAADVRLKLTAAKHFAEVSRLHSLSPVVLRSPAETLHKGCQLLLRRGRVSRRGRVGTAGDWAGVDASLHYIMILAVMAQ